MFGEIISCYICTFTYFSAIQIFTQAESDQSDIFYTQHNTYVHIHIMHIVTPLKENVPLSTVHDLYFKGRTLIGFVLKTLRCMHGKWVEGGAF